MESEYWNSEQMYFDCVTGADIVDFSQYGTSKDLNEEGVGYPVLRLNEFDSLFIGKPAKYCNLIDCETFKSLQLKKDDVLICRTNGNPKYVGKAALVPIDYDYAFASYLFRIRPKADVINTATLVVFLNSRYGRAEIEKYSMVGNQANFSPAKFREIKIPILPKDFQQEIASMVQQAHAKLEESKSFYAQAQTLLDQELNINIESAKTPNVNIKTLSQSFCDSGRLDAEYYQPKYDSLFDSLSPISAKPLGEIVNIEKSIEPGSEAYLSEGIPFYRVSNLSVNGLSDTDIFLDQDEFASALRIKKDTILFSKDGTIGIAYKANRDINGITSGAILHLRVTYSNVLPDYLTLVLNSQIVKLQAERDAGGSIIKHWKPDEIKKVIIPILPEPIQRKISALVQKSFALKTESKQLLETAKAMVEREIEK